MSHPTLRIKLSIVFSMIALMAFSQRQDTVLHNYYKLGKEATLNIDFEHTELSIIPSENDSIAIHTRIRVIPSNPNAPYAGIILKTKQENTNDIYTSIRIGEDIEPHNKLESSCEIHVPKGVHLKLNSHYGIIHLNAPLGNIKATLAYSNFTADTLTTSDSISFTADYSSITLGDMKSKISIEGKNINFTADTINKLKTKTEFSVFNIASAKTVKAQSYTDKFILGEVNSMHINSKKSICLINSLHQFFQGEMKNGLLTLNEINKEFEAINISNSHVATQLNFSTNCFFSINADMRYCLLKQEQLTLQETVAPNSILYNGNYGNSTHKISNLSIISAYGDVSILVK